jgi:hypothetical protein
MSVIFLYTTQRDPPAPFALVDLREPGTADDRLSQLPAQVDSAADRTIVPLKLIERLQLTPSGNAPFAGLGDHEIRLDLYKVEILVRTLTPREIEVAAHATEELILLGRDFLNQFKIVHDGPKERLEISEP